MEKAIHSFYIVNSAVNNSQSEKEKKKSIYCRNF